ncbi:DUF4440 domain-containing protein [Erwinia sp.]|uniref:DUF4440 domain-containing protein n=1 Tax=Erwinia citreus TaxID=558 RepID=UPI003C777ED2
MNTWFTEVLEAHVAIENWLSEGTGELQALLDRFTPDFSMIGLTGAVLDQPKLSGFFRASQAAKPGLKIEIAEMEMVSDWTEGAVVSYREIQSLPGAEPTQRRSTVVFSLSSSGIQWRHLHETPISI